MNGHTRLRTRVDVANMVVRTGGRMSDLRQTGASAPSSPEIMQPFTHELGVRGWVNHARGSGSSSRTFRWHRFWLLSRPVHKVGVRRIGLAWAAGETRASIRCNQ
jgi:hypothetical protein